MLKVISLRGKGLEALGADPGRRSPYHPSVDTTPPISAFQPLPLLHPQAVHPQPPPPPQQGYFPGLGRFEPHWLPPSSSPSPFQGFHSLPPVNTAIPAVNVAAATTAAVIPVVVVPEPKGSHTWELSSLHASPGSVVTVDAVGFSSMPALKNEPHIIVLHAVQGNAAVPVHSVVVTPRSPCSLKFVVPELNDEGISKLSVVVLDPARTRLNHQELSLELTKPSPRTDKRFSLQFLMESTV